MATSYSILGQQQPTGSNVDLYVCPAATDTVVSTIAITNVTSSAATATIYVRKATGTTAQAASTANALAYNVPIAANTFQTVTIGMTLTAYDTVTVASGTSGALTFHAFGSKVTA